MKKGASGNKGKNENKNILIKQDSITHFKIPNKGTIFNNLIVDQFKNINDINRYLRESSGSLSEKVKERNNESASLINDETYIIQGNRTDGTKRKKSAGSVKSVGSAKSAGSVKSVGSAKSVGSVKSVGSSKSVGSAKSVGTIKLAQGEKYIYMNGLGNHLNAKKARNDRGNRNPRELKNKRISFEMKNKKGKKSLSGSSTLRNQGDKRVKNKVQKKNYAKANMRFVKKNIFSSRSSSKEDEVSTHKHALDKIYISLKENKNVGEQMSNDFYIEYDDYDENVDGVDNLEDERVARDAGYMSDADDTSDDDSVSVGDSREMGHKRNIRADRQGESRRARKYMSSNNSSFKAHKKHKNDHENCSVRFMNNHYSNIINMLVRKSEAIFASKKKGNKYMEYDCIGFVCDEEYMCENLHFDENHVESPDRIKCIIKALKEKNIINKMVQIKCREALYDEIKECHTSSHINNIFYSLKKKLKYKKKDVIYPFDKHDTYYTSYTGTVSKRAVGGLLNLCDVILSEKNEKFKYIDFKKSFRYNYNFFKNISPNSISKYMGSKINYTTHLKRSKSESNLCVRGHAKGDFSFVDRRYKPNVTIEHIASGGNARVGNMIKDIGPSNSRHQVNTSNYRYTANIENTKQCDNLMEGECQFGGSGQDESVSLGHVMQGSTSYGNVMHGSESHNGESHNGESHNGGPHIDCPRGAGTDDGLFGVNSIAQECSEVEPEKGGDLKVCKNFLFNKGTDELCKKTYRSYSTTMCNIKDCSSNNINAFTDINCGFAAIRPPGHHCSRNNPSGFCIFNNISVACKYIFKKYGIRKIFIFDWDVHHDNGTQEIFYNDKDVLCFSIHRFDKKKDEGKRRKARNSEGFKKVDTMNCNDKEGKGKKGTTGSNKENQNVSSAKSELGSKNGYKFNINVPLEKGYNNCDVYYVFKYLLLPILQTFQPEFIFISCGFDASINDPLGECNLTHNLYQWMTLQLKCFANVFCKGRIILVLEGGYNLNYLPKCTLACIKALIKKNVNRQKEHGEDEGVEYERTNEGRPSLPVGIMSQLTSPTEKRSGTITRSAAVQRSGVNSTYMNRLDANRLDIGRKSNFAPHKDSVTFGGNNKELITLNNFLNNKHSTNDHAHFYKFKHTSDMLKKGNKAEEYYCENAYPSTATIKKKELIITGKLHYSTYKVIKYFLGILKGDPFHLNIKLPPFNVFVKKKGLDENRHDFFERKINPHGKHDRNAGKRSYNGNGNGSCNGSCSGNGNGSADGSGHCEGNDGEGMEDGQEDGIMNIHVKEKIQELNRLNKKSGKQSSVSSTTISNISHSDLYLSHDDLECTCSSDSSRDSKKKVILLNRLKSRINKHMNTSSSALEVVSGRRKKRKKLANKTKLFCSNSKNVNNGEGVEIWDLTQAQDLQNGITLLDDFRRGRSSTNSMRRSANHGGHGGQGGHGRSYIDMKKQSHLKSGGILVNSSHLFNHKQLHIRSPPLNGDVDKVNNCHMHCDLTNLKYSDNQLQNSFTMYTKSKKGFIFFYGSGHRNQWVLPVHKKITRIIKLCSESESFFYAWLYLCCEKNICITNTKSNYSSILEDKVRVKGMYISRDFSEDERRLGKQFLKFTVPCYHSFLKRSQLQRLGSIRREETNEEVENNPDEAIGEDAENPQSSLHGNLCDPNDAYINKCISDILKMNHNKGNDMTKEGGGDLRVNGNVSRKISFKKKSADDDMCIGTGQKRHLNEDERDNSDQVVILLNGDEKVPRVYKENGRNGDTHFLRKSNSVEMILDRISTDNMVSRSNDDMPNGRRSYTQGKKKAVAKRETCGTSEKGGLRNNGKEKHFCKDEYKTAVCLANVLSTMRHPCVMDVKMGIRLYGDNCDKKSIQKKIEKAKNRSCLSHGFHLTSVIGWCKKKKEPFFISKEDAHSIKNDHDFVGAFISYFLACDNIHLSLLLLKKILIILEHMKNFFEHQKYFAFYGSSLLFVFDSDPSKNKCEHLENDNYTYVQPGLGHYINASPVEKANGDNGNIHERYKMGDKNKQEKYNKWEKTNYREILNFREKIQKIFEDSLTDKERSIYIGSKLNTKVLKSANVYIIDFAHASLNKKEKDTGFLLGITSLHRILKKTIERLQSVYLGK
ncbi:histone deacetylase [Plasmodium ovale curtisi]|uniref:histone deacetylase n=1 Tax=Plasmodium ovale curtisi TaxID=864141 RepID=A0A1A8W3V6_PLAOA|nr:histone deacetylase [Plasmodium ovale curtisi]